MKISRQHFITVFLLLSGLVVLSNCQDEEGGGEVEETPRTCQSWLFNLVDMVFAALGPCLGGGWGLNGIHEVFTRVFCLVKCIITELGLLDEEGKLDQVSAAVFFGDNFPAELRNIIVPAAEPCFAFAENFDGKEYHCRSYADFSQCAATVVVKALVPYSVDCFGSGILSIGLNAVFGVLKVLTPRTPNIVKEEMTRAQEAKSLAIPPKCFDPPACDKNFKYKKINGSSAVVWYDKNMTEIAVEFKKPKAARRRP